MFYALIVICLADAPVCDVEHSIYATRSAPIFPSEAICRAGAIARLHATWFAIPGIDSGVEYRVEIDCRRPGPAV